MAVRCAACIYLEVKLEAEKDGNDGIRDKAEHEEAPIPAEVESVLVDTVALWVIEEIDVGDFDMVYAKDIRSEKDVFKQQIDIKQPPRLQICPVLQYPI